MPKLRSDDDSERQTEDSDDDDSEHQIENSGNDSERRNRGCNSEYRSENRRWLWTPKLKSDDGSERRNWENNSFGSQIKKLTLNTKLEE